MSDVFCFEYCAEITRVIKRSSVDLANGEARPPVKFGYLQATSKPHRDTFIIELAALELNPRGASNGQSQYIYVVVQSYVCSATRK